MTSALQFFKVHTLAQDPGAAGLGEFAEPQEAAVWYSRLLATEAHQRRCERAARKDQDAPEPRGRTFRVLVRRPGRVARCFKVKIGADFWPVSVEEVPR